MGRVNRLGASGAAAVAAAIAFAPAVLAVQPTPSPALSTVLVAPSGAYAEATGSTGDGPMSAADYAGSDSLVLDELQRDGYVEGYIRTWVTEDQKHAVVEEVIAFSGKRTAGSWLATLKGRSNSQYMVRPITADGVDTYFGAHYAEPATPVYFDEGAFIKGNDFFTVTALSKADDLGDLATSQAKRQFDAAPPYSISPNQWPENAGRNSLNLSAATLPLAIGGGAFLVVVILVVLVVVVLVTRRPSQPALAPAMAAAPMGAAGSAAPAPAAGPMMSQDGRYWWDGQAWRDTEKEAPPDAMRSADGYYWWDSRTWRPVPKSEPSPPATPS